MLSKSGSPAFSHQRRSSRKVVLVSAKTAQFTQTVTGKGSLSQEIKLYVCLPVCCLD